MSPELDRVEATAIEACLAGGRYLREAFRSETTTAQHLDHDVKSSADTESETRMLSIIDSRFPDHHVVAEESGTQEGESGVQYKWIVDPLDGTNNFESGLPTFATAVTVLAEGNPVVGVAYAPVLDDIYVGRRGEGVRYNGRPVEAEGDEIDSSHATVASVIGHEVKTIPEQSAISERINRAIESRCKRRLESWNPTVHWGLLARGRLDGIVCYRPDAEEQRLGELFAAESGLERKSEENWFVGATTTDLLMELEDIVGECR